MLEQAFSANFSVFEQVARGVFEACMLCFHCASFPIKCPRKALLRDPVHYFLRGPEGAS